MALPCLSVGKRGRVVPPLGHCVPCQPGGSPQGGGRRGLLDVPATAPPPLQPELVRCHSPCEQQVGSRDGAEPRSARSSPPLTRPCGARYASTITHPFRPRATPFGTPATVDTERHLLHSPTVHSPNEKQNFLGQADAPPPSPPPSSLLAAQPSAKGSALASTVFRHSQDKLTPTKTVCRRQNKKSTAGSHTIGTHAARPDHNDQNKALNKKK